MKEETVFTLSEEVRDVPPYICPMAIRLYTILLTSCLLCLGSNLLAQSATKRKAIAFAEEAREAFKAQEYIEAINYYEEALTHDGDHYGYQIGLAKSYFLAGQYRECIHLVGPMTKSRKLRGAEQVEPIRLYAGSLDMIGKEKQARKALSQALKKYPDAGELYHEYGLLELGNGNSFQALTWFEKGIYQAPGYAQNYFQAGLLLEEWGDFGWAIIYLEQYLNLSRFSNQASLVSSRIVQIYEQVHGCQNLYCGFDFHPNFEAIPPQAFKRDDVLLDAYHEEYGLALEDDGSAFSPRLCYLVQLNALPALKEREDMKALKPYLNWLTQIEKRGHLEAYQYWLMQNGYTNAFVNWTQLNPVAYKDFENWFLKNSLLDFAGGPMLRPAASKANSK